MACFHSVMAPSMSPLSNNRQARVLTYSALAEHGLASGLPEVSHRKIFDVLDAGRRALEMADRAGVSIVYGTDLLGKMHEFQNREFTLRAEVQSAPNIVKAATITAARLLKMEGQIGTVQPGAYADLLVVDGNPLEDVGVLADPVTHVQLVMKAGQICADRL